MTEIDLEQRRWIGRGIRFGLIALTVVLVLNWTRGRVSRGARHAIGTTNVVMNAPAPTTPLGPGDMRIVSTNGAVELVLQGDRVLAGMSAEKIAEVRAKLEDSRSKDTSGFGGMIAASVKRGVSEMIGAHASWPVSDIRDISYENGRLVLQTKSSGRAQLFDKDEGNSRELFAPQDAERFVAAVHARMAERR